MSSSKLEKIDISGIDWMIFYMGWRSRKTVAAGNHFSIIAEVTESFHFERFSRNISALKNIKSFLSGKIKRKIPAWRPCWYFEKGTGEGIVCCKNTEDTEIQTTNKLPEGVSLQIIYFERKKKLLFTFSHAVFDGVGAEKFIAWLFREEISDEFPVREIPLDVQKMKKSGQELRELMKKFPEKKILRLPNARKGKNEFERIHIPQEQYRSLVKSVEQKYGPFSISLYIFALILCNLEKYIFPSDSKKEYIFIPMSVDQRNTRKEPFDMFFNHWSLMPLLISRSVLAEGVPAAVLHLKRLYSESLSSKNSQLFYDASEAMKYVPCRGIDLMVKFSPAKTLGTLMFSFLNSNHCRTENFNNFAHYPNMPKGNNLGFFVNLYNDNLNIVISRKPWKNDHTFGIFLKEIFAQLQEEAK